MGNSVIINTRSLGFPWETQNPFLFCVHHLDFYPEGNKELEPNASLAGRNIGNDFVIKDGWRMYHGDKIPGFPVHPHRGFETITVVLRGLVDHSDSSGASGRYGNGDVQWMTAGKGLQHSEMFPLLKNNEPNILELFQIWLNLPADRKFVKPHFAMLWKEDIPVLIAEDAEGKLTEVIVIAGQLEGKIAPPPAPDSWAADPANEVAVWRIKMDAGAGWTLPTASGDVQRSLYFFKGKSLLLNEESYNTHLAFTLKPDQQLTLTNGDEEAHLLLLQGKPINEPIVQYGPFVMNNQAEIQQTMMDYQRTQFGGWPWPRPDQVHDPLEDRFARFADGSRKSPPD